MLNGIKFLIGTLFALFACGGPSFGFQERSIGEADRSVGLPSAPQLPGLDLKAPELGTGASAGTEIRIPGLGNVGTVPKLDFGLELLYGASDLAGRFDERSQPSDVQIRATIKHRF
jgi:hypothetical protein